MRNHVKLRLPLTLALSLFATLAHAEFTNGLFRIISGTYVEVGGFAGTVSSPLPNTAQAFLKLEVDRIANRAELTFLEESMTNVFVIAPCSRSYRFTYHLTNGVVSGDRIMFGYIDEGYPAPNAIPTFIVSNFAGGVRLNGTANYGYPLPHWPCVDVPYYFLHTNVVAVPVPSSAIRFSEAEVSWASLSNQNYQVQYRSRLGTNAWTNLGTPLLGNGSTMSVSNKVPLADPTRFYRVIPVP